MAPMNLPWEVLDRPIKPVALALMYTMFITAEEAFNGDGGVLGATVWAHAVGVVAAITGFAFVTAWFLRSQRLAEAALLGAFFVWGFRVVLYLTLTHPQWERSALAACYALVCAGSFLLEVADPTDPMSHPVRHPKRGEVA